MPHQHRERVQGWRKIIIIVKWRIITLHCLDLCFHYFYLLRIDGIKVSLVQLYRVQITRSAPGAFQSVYASRFGAVSVPDARAGAAPVGDTRRPPPRCCMRPRVASSARAFALSWARLLEAELSAFNMECDEIYGFSLLSFPSRGPAAPLSSIHYSALRSRRGNCRDLLYIWHYPIFALKFFYTEFCSFSRFQVSVIT